MTHTVHISAMSLSSVQHRNDEIAEPEHRHVRFKPRFARSETTVMLIVRPDRIQHDVRRPRFSFDISSTYIRHPNQLTCNHLLASERIYKLIYTCSISSLRLYYWHVFNAFIRCLS